MLPLQNVVEKLAAGAILEHKETNVVPLPDLLEFDYVRVILQSELDSKILLLLTRSLRMLISLMKVV